MANSIRNTIHMDSLFHGFFNSTATKEADTKVLDIKPTAESVTLRPGLFLPTIEMERKFELNNHLARTSIWNTLFILCTPLYVLTAYWSHFLMGLDSPELVPLCVISVLSFVITTTLSISILFTTDAETIVYSPSIRRLFGITGFTHFFCYAVIYVLEGYHNTCHPLSVHCKYEEFPVDVFFCLMFVTITMQLGFPSFPWGYALALQLTAGLFVFASIPLYNSSQQVPVTLLGVLSITGSVLVRRRDAVGYFRLTLQIEEQKEFEQQAKLGDRLRLMISGVAHDLKSPLSALALGLESIPGIYDSIRNIVQADMSRDERIRLSEVLLETVKDLGYGMDHSRHAMGTIISRCVDINQALNGIPLVPCLQVIDVPTAVDQVVTNYREENAQVRITVTTDPDIGSIESDLFWVQESLSCLVSNAVKFCDYSDSDTHTERSEEDSTRQIDVVVTKVARSTQVSAFSRKMNRENDEFIRFEVWDEGIGVGEDMEVSLFTFLGHSRQVRVGGAGLGLGSLACRIRTLGGSYGYFSRRKLDCGKLPKSSRMSTSKRCNQGSIFWFEIPLKISEELREQWTVVAPSNINTNTHHPGEYANKDVGFALHEAHRPSSVSSTPIFSKGAKLTPTKAGSSTAGSTTAAPIAPRNASARVAPDPTSIHSTGSNANSMSSGITSQQQVEGIRTIHRRTQEVRSQLMGEISTSSIPLSSASSTSMVNGGGITPRESHSLMPTRRVPGAMEPEPTSMSMFFHSAAAATPRFSVRSVHLSTMPSHHNVQPPSTSSSNAGTEATSVHSCHAFQAPPVTVMEEDDEALKVDSLATPVPTRRDANQQMQTPATVVMTPPTSSHITGEACDVLLNHGSPVNSTEASGSPPTMQQPSCSRMRPDLVVKIHTDTSPVATASDAAKGVCNGATICTASKVTRKLHVLVVDDSMPIRKMCSMILKQHGHSVVTAMNGKEALQMMIQACDARVAATSSSPAGTMPASEAIDLVLMDIQMPVMDGLEAVTLYRAHEAPLMEKLQQAAQTSPVSSAVLMKPLLIIGMSACSDVDIIEKGLSIGMDRFVAKPFQIHHLTPILNESFPSAGV